jgi:superoxide dismutase, Fe-Mn family
MFTLMQLPFDSTALEPIISAQTLSFHHGKHHQTYVDNLNKLIADVPELESMTLEEILKSLKTFPDAKKTAILNNAGQVYNHNIYWESMQGGDQKFELSPELGAAIDDFESYENFQKLWTEAGLTQFGSGWVWLSTDKAGKLSITKSANADSPLTLSEGQTPIMTMDVWEHAYYLDYQNKRAEYIAKFFDLINWSEVSRKYSEALK